MQEYVNLSIAGHLAVIRSKLSAQRNAPTHFKNILTFRAWGNTGKKKKCHIATMSNGVPSSWTCVNVPSSQNNSTHSHERNTADYKSKFTHK